MFAIRSIEWRVFYFRVGQFRFCLFSCQYKWFIYLIGNLHVFRFTENVYLVQIKSAHPATYSDTWFNVRYNEYRCCYLLIFRYVFIYIGYHIFLDLQSFL